MSSIAEAVKEFILHCKIEKRLSEKTLKAYQTDLTQFNCFLLSNEIPADITTIAKPALRKYLESISHLKPKSVKRKIASLKAMFNFFEFEEESFVNPLRKMKIRIKDARVLPKTISLRDIAKILRLVYRQKKSSCSDDSFSFFEAMRNIVVVELLFSTGGRVSEIANLKDSDINLKTGDILITGKGGKQRIIQLCNEEQLFLLRTYRGLCEKRIRHSGNYFLVNKFSNKMSDQSIRLLVRKLYKQAGIKKHITPHMFRHSFATLLLERNVDIKYIQEMLGHSSIMTTQIYTHVNKQRQRALLKSRHPRGTLKLA